MTRIAYYLALPFLYGISLLPFRLLYFLSDVFFVILFYGIGYRKAVVWNNLRNSFPEKSEEEVRRIYRKFYRYFCDLVLETLKLITLSTRELNKRVQFHNLDVYQNFYKQNRSVLMVMGHVGNWEWIGSRFSQAPIHTFYAIYHPLSNPYFEQLLYRMRTRMGFHLYTMQETLRGMLKNRNELTITGFAADQTPPSANAYWTTFLEQDTAFFTGPGRLSKKFNLPVVYTAIYRPVRGYYEFYSEVLVENPQDYTEQEIQELFIRRLEQNIQQQPEIWLWSHRRWKHKRTAPEGERLKDKD